MTDRDTSAVTAICERCGIGKSTFIHAFMQYTVSCSYYERRKEPIGLVIITDSVKRLEATADTSKDRENAPDDWKDLFEMLGEPDHFEELKNQIIVLRAGEPFGDQLRRQHFKSIVLLTTQRYFMLSDNLRDELFWFSHEGQKIERGITFFDETPYFNEYVSVDRTSLTKMDGILRDCLSDEVKDKNFAVSEFHNFAWGLIDMMETAEKKKDKSLRFYWKNENVTTITRNDEQFFSVIEDNMQDLMEKNENIQRDIFHLQYIAAHGAILDSSKAADGKYSLSLNTVIDNRNCFFLGGNRKFFVFDATGDIDPKYDVDYVRMAELEKTDAQVKLGIITYRYKSSKNNLQKKAQYAGGKGIKVLSETLRQIKESTTKNGEPALLLTYSSQVKHYGKDFEHVRYFGSLKGFNDYKDFHHMFHVGLNRFPQMQYLLIYYGCHPDEYRKLQEMSENESMKLLDPVFKRKYNQSPIGNYIEEIMLRSVLVDLEQNIFRLSVRNMDNNRLVKVHLLYDYMDKASSWDKLKKKIENRFKPMGAQFRYSPELPQYGLNKATVRETGEGRPLSHVQKVILFITAKKKGEKFTTKEILAETGLTDKQFQKTKANGSVRKLLDGYKTELKGTYRIR